MTPNVKKLFSELRASGHHADAYVVSMTPELAKQVLEGNVNNRPPRAAMIRYYRRLLRQHEWVYSGQGIVLCKDSARILNGQHTLMAIAEEGVTVQILVVMDVEDSAWKYMDQGGRRSRSDVIGDVANRKLVSTVLGLLWREETTGIDANPRRLEPNDAPEVLSAYPEAIEAASFAAGAASSESLLPRTIVAYARVRTAMFDPQKSTEFLRQVTTGVGLAANDPANLLRRVLITQAKAIRRASTTYLIALLIKSWRAFLDGASIRCLKFDEHRDLYPVWPGKPLSRLPAKLTRGENKEKTP